MNINLTAAGKKRSRPIGYGLNDRKQAQRSVFGDESSDSGEDGDKKKSGRHDVNRAILAEQDALRKRAAMAAASDLYDFDGSYEKFKPQQGPAKKESRKSRYIEDLLHAAKNRERERDAIYERNIAREQAQEENEYEGKDKFITKTYKKKLAERELWVKEEEERRQKEELEDVTKKTAGTAFASFYGNLSSRNVAMGGGEGIENASEETYSTEMSDSKQLGAKNVEAHTFSKARKESSTGSENENGKQNSEVYLSPIEKVASAEDKNDLARKQREEKVAHERREYFQRINQARTSHCGLVEAARLA